MQNLDFATFGVKDNHRKLFKTSGILELISGILYMIFAFLFLILFFAFVFNDEPLIKSLCLLLDLVGNDGNPVGSMFALFALGIGAVFIVVGIIATVSGANMLKRAKNPITLIKSRAKLIAMAILYIVLLCLFVSCFFYIVGIINYIFTSLAIALLIVTIVLKFICAKIIPNTTSVLDVTNLSKEELEKIEENSAPLPKPKKTKKINNF